MAGRANAGSGADDGNPDGQKHFNRTREEGWAEEVDSWPWNDRGDNETAVKTGRCPRCDHSVTFVDSTVIYAAFRTAEPIEAPSRRYAACNCGVQHPGTPDGEAGCGANGLIERPLPKQGETQ